MTYQTEIINTATTSGANMTYQTELINTAPKISLKVAKRIRNCTHTHTHTPTPLINTANTHQVHTHVSLILRVSKSRGAILNPFLKPPRLTFRSVLSVGFSVEIARFFWIRRENNLQWVRSRATLFPNNCSILVTVSDFCHSGLPHSCYFCGGFRN